MTGKQGTKHDGGKDPWDLAPWDAFRAVVSVLSFGAKKYARNNWRLGIQYSRLYSATIRHLTAWWEGQDLDPETGLSHLAHAGCCVMFMLAFAIQGRTELDDRAENNAKLSASEPEAIRTQDVSAVLREGSSGA